MIERCCLLCVVFFVWCFVCGALALGVRSLVFGVLSGPRWCVGVWRLVFGVWCLLFDDRVCCFVLGGWCSVFWCLVSGVWCFGALAFWCSGGLTCWP